MNSNLYWIGEDLGMGANKLYSSLGGLEVVSQVATNGREHLSDAVGLRQRKPPMTVTWDGGSFYVGENAHDFGRPVENLDFDRLTGAPEMRALLYGSLGRYQALYGTFEGPIGLLVGLPLQMMMGEQAADFARQVKGWLRGTHIWKLDGQQYEAEVGEVKLTAQPVGALFDYVADEAGRLVPERRDVLRKEVGVLSVGFNTLELLVVREGAPVERFVAGNTVGVRRLLELVNREGMYSLGELDSLLRAGRIDISQALPIWAREVNGEIEKRWGGAFKRFAKVLVVGGGALLLKDALTAQFRGKAVVADNPVMSIARGLWKLAILKR